MRSRWSCWTLLVAVLLLGATFPSDDAGRPAPWCSYVDDSVTPNVSVPCSVTHPLPSGSTSSAIATDIFGYGRAFFFGGTATASGVTLTPAVPSITLFTDAVAVAGLHASSAPFHLVAQSSNDGGKTWAPAIDTGFPAGGANPPNTLIRTASPTPRFVTTFTGNASGSIANSSNLVSGWAFSTGIPQANATYSVAAQGAAVLAIGPDAASTATVGCISADNGQTFPTCVTVDAAAPSIPGAASSPLIATPSINIWLTLLNNGKIWRSADNGATWTTVATLASQGTIVCLSSTVCVAVNGGSTVSRSTNAGLTWTTGVTLPGGNAAFSICPYSATILDVLTIASWPSTAVGVTIPAFRSIDGGVTFVSTPATGGIAAFAGGAITMAGGCTTTAGGRTSFVVQRTNLLATYYGTVLQNAVQIVGANGLTLTLDANGNPTVNQGLPQATSPNAWGVSPVQGPALFNTQTTSGAIAAQTVTITAVAGQRVHLREINASCNTAAATAPTLVVLDGATQIWSLAATETVLAAVRTVKAWAPSLDNTTGNALSVTLGACTAGTSLLSVQADQF